MTAQERSRFEEIRQMIREMEERIDARFQRAETENDRRYESLVRENASLRTQIARMQARMMPPEAWQDFDAETDRRRSAS